MSRHNQKLNNIERLLQTRQSDETDHTPVLFVTARQLEMLRAGKNLVEVGLVKASCKHGNFVLLPEKPGYECPGTLC